MIQSYWHAWINPVLERSRRHPRYLELLAPLLGPNIKQMANQIHWKHPSAKYTFYRYHQDIRFRREELFDDVVANSVTCGLAIEKQDDCESVIEGTYLGEGTTCDECDFCSDPWPDHAV